VGVVIFPGNVVRFNMALPLHIIKTVLAIPRWFSRLRTSKKRSKDYIYLTVEEVIEFNLKL
jgi:hypothetical protein